MTAAPGDDYNAQEARPAARTGRAVERIRMANRDQLSSTRRIPHGGGWGQVIELSGTAFCVKEGPDRGRSVLDLHTVVRIGTAPDNDLILTDPTVSRHHARVSSTPKGLLVTDLKSRNGTFVRGIQVGEALLGDERELRVGQTVIQLVPQVRECVALPTEEDGLGDLVGGSPPMREVYGLIRAVAPSAATVLITGESGTGKELAARAVHALSGRKGPLVVFDCASTSQDLIRSELFGHRTGAFTGAVADREGALRRAHTGTLLIDELGDLPLALQPMLLRVLETREVTPVGADRAVPVNVRVLAATKLDLDQMVREGRFRDDLLHRLRVVTMRMPSLREHPEDLPALIEHYRRALAPSLEIAPDALQALASHSWPGNVRALRNSIERLGIVCRGRTVRPGDLGLTRGEDSPAPADPVNLEELERQAIQKALERTGGNRAQAARLLGIGLTTLKNKLRRPGP